VFLFYGVVFFVVFYIIVLWYNFSGFDLSLIKIQTGNNVIPLNMKVKFLFNKLINSFAD